MNRWNFSLLALAASVWVITAAAPAAAATCTITGTVAVEPLDGYYCDTTFGNNCSGWKVVDLDAARGAAAKRLPYMRMEAWQGSNYLGKTHTSSTGTYSITFAVPGSTCAGQSVTMQHWMERIHEADLNASTKRYRFAVVAYDPALGPNNTSQMLNRWKVLVPVSLTGANTSLTVTFAANSSLGSRLANMYFTVNSAITDIVTWTSRLDGHFSHASGGADGILRVIYGPDWAGGGGNATADWGLLMQYDTYNRGSVTRHELGHLVREALHDRACSLDRCSTYNLYSAGSYDADSCEYGSAAFNEGIASFFGIRSATTHDTNVWDCRCRDNGNQGICSQTSNNLTTPDKVQDCTGGGFVGVGDRWIVSSETCKRLSPTNGCSGCPTGADGFCIPLYSALAGWRNVVQVMRFMWDLIDTSSDGGWDNVDYTAGSLVTAMQSMPTGFGEDGSCREPEHPPAQDCNPAVDGSPVSGGTGSRDAYNPRDISDLLPEDLANVMDINCVGFATDN
ncbi:MAG: hypothetical protein HYZ29_14685 [Myxococcales bacterium]|nr:hypothetical protein [Myxococcales bacterium]